MPNPKSSDLIALSHADGPASEHAGALKLYGQFVGDWIADIVTYTPDGVRHDGEAEIHFGWVLEGRAIQDVWMIPRRDQRGADLPAMAVAGNWYGTTIRVYDPALDAWRIYWIDPATNVYYQQTGRRQGRTSCRKVRPKTARCRAGASPGSHRGRVMAPAGRSLRPPAFRSA